MIKLWYHAVDGTEFSREFKTQVGAQAFAERMLGLTPEVYRESFYAVSSDGIATIEWAGTEPQKLWPRAFA
jgi:hypothetical protein